MRQTLKTTIRAGVAVALLGWAAAAAAQPAERLAIHGFGGWAAGHTDNDNHYGNIASKDWELNNYYFALNVAARPTDELSIHAQAFWGDDMRGKQLQLDYAFAEWQVSPELRLRAGKVMSPLGIYTEVFDVGTLRPFYLLPQSIYAGGGTVSKSYLGGGLTGSHSFGDWELSYDLFGGEMRFIDYDVDTVVGVDPTTMAPVWKTISFSTIGRSLVGAKLALAPPVKGLELGVSYANVEMFGSIDGGPRIQEDGYGLRGGHDDLVVVHLQYEPERLSLKSEYALKRSRGNDLDRGYVEAAYKVLDKLQLAASYEWFSLSFPEDSSVTPQIRESSWAEHKAIGAALNYWPSPNFVVKLNYYRVNGNFHARPEQSLQRAIMGTLNDKTNVVVIGTQFSF